MSLRQHLPHFLAEPVFPIWQSPRQATAKGGKSHRSLLIITKASAHRPRQHYPPSPVCVCHMIKDEPVGIAAGPQEKVFLAGRRTSIGPLNGPIVVAFGQLDGAVQALTRHGTQVCPDLLRRNGERFACLNAR